MSSAIAIIDPICLTPSTISALDAEPVGGTEAVILKVARALSDRFRFHFYQNGRLDMDRATGSIYRPLDAATAENLAGIEKIIVISSWKMALKARKLNANCPIYLWSHTHPGRQNRRMGEALADANIEIICCSNAHADHVAQFLIPENSRLPKISCIHTPVDDQLMPDDTPRDRDRLFFPGMPLRGISEIVEKFQHLRQQRPTLQLDIAEPANLVWPAGAPPQGVNFLGKLSYDATIDQMRRSLCVFYPQTRNDEVFNLLLAEANAVGTPVIAQRGLGANDEIVGMAGQVLDTDDLEALGQKIDAWRTRPPKISLLPALRMKAVAKRWREKLGVGTPGDQGVSGLAPQGIASKSVASPNT